MEIRNPERYINVTLIAMNGAPTTEQVWTSDPLDAMSYVRCQAIQRIRGSWAMPLVAAFIHDTHYNRLRQFRISKEGHINEVQ